MRKIFLIRSVFIIFILGIAASSYCEQLESTIKLEKYDGGFFTIDKPQGWKITTAGQCSTFAFLIQDPARPIRKIFYFGQIGPVYLSLSQKQFDYQYMSMGGYPVTWYEMPVVDPLTPANFLKSFSLISPTKMAQGFMSQFPRLDNLKTISTTSQLNLISGATTELVRAVFSEGPDVGELLALVTVAPLILSTGAPGGGIGYGFLISGISAPKPEFRDSEDILVKSLKSFVMSQSYVNTCMAQQDAAYHGTLKAGKTLSETSDIITNGWNERNKTYDIISKKRSDAILGAERVYDPGTNEVYEVSNGFYEKYNQDRNSYQMNNLQQLPDNSYQLWTQPPKDGNKNIK